MAFGREGGGPEFPREIPKDRPLVARREIEERCAKGEHLERLTMTDLALGGAKLEGRRFCGSDVRGLVLYDEEQTERTDIRKTDWTDATVGDFGAETIFAYADAEDAVFGFSETLAERRGRHERLEAKPSVDDSGAYFNFNGQQAKFARTRWRNVDFGGAVEGYEARLEGADLRNAVMEGCDLTNIDLSETNIEGLTIQDPVSLVRMKITTRQAPAVARAIVCADRAMRARFAARIAEEGENKALADLFGVVIVEDEKN